MEITTKVPGATNLLAALCRELRIAEYVNQMVPWDEKQCKVSPGTLVVALVINILVNHVPLYRLEAFYKNLDLPLLFDEDVSAEDLNDDALARALDKLSLIDKPRLIHTVACRGIAVEDMQVDFVHADTTSLSVQGVYDCYDSDDGEVKYLKITYGLSKDERPDLKQFKFGLCVNSDGFPILGDVHDGNKNDGVWNKEMLKQIEASFLNYESTVYVADSALVTTENIQQMLAKGIKFISLLPGRFSLATELREQAWAEDNWTYQGKLSAKKNAAEYWTQSIQTEFAGSICRFVVVRSSNLDKRKEKKLASQLKKEAAELTKLVKKVNKEVFQCRPDAEARLAEILSNHKMLHGLTGQVIEESKVKRPPGRPPKDAVFETVTTYKLELEICEPTQEVLDHWRQKEATFVLVTNESREKLDDRSVLSQYKNQSRAEMCFRFLKQPLFVRGIFLKTPRRVEALGYVILLAVMVAAFLQRRIRKALQDQNATILAPGNRVLDRSTVTAILDMLQYISVVYLHHGTHTERYLPTNTSPEILKLLRLAGYDERIYLART